MTRVKPMPHVLFGHHAFNQIRLNIFEKSTVIFQAQCKLTGQSVS